MGALEDMREMDIQFLNLNELEITVGNHGNMEVRGFNLSDEITAGAAGSAELANQHARQGRCCCPWEADPIDGVVREPYGFHLKFCTAVYKDAGTTQKQIPETRRGYYRTS